ncbi:TRAM domain-containing protein [Candidatus Saccharibacteria bacterium]|nr:TRAM domain-containing protein [Candidatus Saccharibacteria bacterium]
MDYLILAICLTILSETTFLSLKKVRPTKSGKRKIFVDTSALIDGRIVGVARTGFIDGDLIVLKSVLRELQLLADGKDPERRNRARDGLDNVAELERVVEVNTEVMDDNGKGEKVDDLLLVKAREHNGLVLTMDYNLIKVAEAEKVGTLNLNDLVLALKTDFEPGKRVKVKILEKGTGQGQGVGHLDDGAMVIVEGASKMMNKEVMVELLRIHETSSGRIVFARLAK